jgi:hypothetical protein
MINESLYNSTSLINSMTFTPQGRKNFSFGNEFKSLVGKLDKKKVDKYQPISFEIGQDRSRSNMPHKESIRTFGSSEVNRV